MSKDVWNSQQIFGPVCVFYITTNPNMPHESSFFQCERITLIRADYYPSFSRFRNPGQFKVTIHQFNSILIVDDRSVVRGVVRKLLMQLGFKNIDEASD